MRGVENKKRVEAEAINTAFKRSINGFQGIFDRLLNELILVNQRVDQLEQQIAAYELKQGTAATQRIAEKTFIS